MEGANRAGWESYLVRTGIYTDAGPYDKATHTVDHVGNAIDHILKKSEEK